jgi:ketosteroid isomerase-like protein
VNRADYDRYVRCFNARDYEAVLEYWASDFDLTFAGYHFHTKAEVRDFHAFFHQYAKETVLVTAFVSRPEMVALEATVRLEGIRELTRTTLESKGFGRLVGLGVGQVVEIPQYIHYHLRDGKIVRAGCALL